MGLHRNLLLVFSALLLASFCSAEFVPVYIWGTQNLGDSVPALYKISQNSFKDEIVNKLKTHPKILVFAEHSLSPEDFGQRDRLGNIAFPYLSKLRKTSKVTYLSYVQNPIKATQHALQDVAEISIQRLKENFEIPDARIVIIDLNDATENEERFDMLKRHDELIALVYDSFLEKYDNVLAMYTGHHASWIGSQVHSRRTRALLDGTTTVNQYIDNSTILFYTSGDAVVIANYTTTSIPVTYTAENQSGVITLTGTGPLINVSFQFNKSTTGYWYLQETRIDYNSKSFNQSSNATIYAPLGFSYACGNQTFKATDFTITFPHFQVEPPYKTTFWTRSSKFNDPYNCVGFTTIPIWSGLFVTFILLLIMTFGLTMMMDIKTMDRFDDAKGKTITINTSE